MSMVQTAAAVVAVVEVETWRNPGEARVVLLRLDHLGNLNREEIIRGGATFTITPRERELNSQKAYNPGLDFFSNGTLVPVALIEGSEAAREFAANPNLLSDGDMRQLVRPAQKASAKAAADGAFAERLAQIQNATTVGRLLALAEEEDAPVSRVRAIQARLAEIEGMGLAVGSDTPVPTPRDEQIRRPGTSRPVTPR